MLTVVESNSAADRFEAAADFAWSFPRGSDLLIVGASREAADEFALTLAASAGAVHGWQRWSFLQLAAQLAGPDFLERGLAIPSPLAADALAVRAVHRALARDDLTSLAPVARYPGFPRALAATLEELRLAEVDPAEVSDLQPGSKELAVLLNAVEWERSLAGVADRAALLASATAGARQCLPPAGAPILLLDVPIHSRRERDLVAALAETAPEVLATLPAGDVRCRRFFLSLEGVPTPLPAAAPRTSLSRLRRYLFEDVAPPPAEMDDSVVFFSAPGEQRECVEIARAILREAADGVRFDEMAVFLRAPTQYVAPLEHALRRASIPFFLARGSRRPDPAGRAFLTLLQVREDGLSARRFHEYLSLDQIPLAGESGTDSVPLAWERLLQEAAAEGGRDRWARRLHRLRAELGLRREEAQREDPEGPAAAELAHRQEALDDLMRTVLPLIDLLDSFPETASWGEWLEVLARLAPLALRDPVRVLAVLAELAPLGVVGPVSLVEVIQTLTRPLLELEREPETHRYGTVFVGPPEEARGRHFRVVLVPGLAERLFPQRPREDALLGDSLRRQLDAALPRFEDRADAERLRLRLVVGAATERLYLSYPRIDVVTGRPRVPSFYGLDVVRAMTGSLPDFEELERQAARRGRARLAWPAPDEADEAIDATEHDLAVLGHLLRDTSVDPRGRARYLLDLNPALGRSLRARWRRWEVPGWTTADGPVRVTETTRVWFEAARPRLRPHSAASLERFAACPYQFYLAEVVGLAPVAQSATAPPDGLDTRTRRRLRRTLREAVLQRLARADGNGFDLDDEERLTAAFEGALASLTENLRDSLASPLESSWQQEIHDARLELEVWLRQQAHPEREWEPIAAGVDLDAAPSEGTAAPSEPQGAAGTATEFALRGRVDLVEERQADRLRRVSLLRSHGEPPRRSTIVAGGSLLSPVLSALGLEAQGGQPVAEARLFFLHAGAGFRDFAIPLDAAARRYAREVLDTVDRAVASGWLPPVPREERRSGRDGSACDACDFRPVCGPYELIRSRRKEQAPLHLLHRLREFP